MSPKTRLFKVVLVLPLVLLAFSSLAQDAYTSDTGFPIAAVDEIEVIGERRITALRFQIREAEVAMYDVLNGINDTKKYQVSCELEAPLGTRIKMQQVCHPRYYYDAVGEEGAAMLNDMRNAGAGMSFRGDSALATIHREDLIFQEIVKQAVIDNPQFVQAILNLSELQEKLESMREEQFGD